MSSELVEADVLILTEESPFSGYYHEYPEGDMPMYLFLPLNSERTCYEDEILRISAAVEHETGIKPDARFAAYTMYHKEFPCMRLKITDLSDLQALINRFKNSELTFESKTLVPRFESFIRIKKYSELDEKIENVFQDVHHKKICYIRASKYLSKLDFSKAVNAVHDSKEFPHFDAAQASFFTRDTVIEMIRVYTDAFKPEDYTRLHQAFEYQIRLHG